MDKMYFVRQFQPNGKWNVFYQEGASCVDPDNSRLCYLGEAKTLQDAENVIKADRDGKEAA